MRKATFMLLYLLVSQISLVRAQSAKMIDDTRAEILQRPGQNASSVSWLNPAEAKTVSPEKSNLQNKNSKTLAPGPRFFGYVAYPNQSSINIGPMSFSPDNPGVVTSIANQTGQNFISGASWANGLWYGAVNTNAGDSLVTIDTATGTRTQIGVFGKYVDALAYDWTTSTMYASAWNGTNYELNTVDLNTGALTLIDTLYGDYFVDLACDNNGILYSIGINNNMLYTIDKNTAAVTTIGSTGIFAWYSQDLEFENSSGIMYYAAFNNTYSQGELRTVNLATGSTTLIGAFAGGMEVTGFAIPNTPYVPLADDLSAVSMTSPTQVNNLPAVYHPEMVVTNTGSNSQSNFMVGYSVNNGPAIMETWNTTLAGQGGSGIYSFSQGFPVTNCNASYSIRLFTALSGDMNLFNDTIADSIKVVTYLQVSQAGSVQSAIGSLLSGSGLTITNLSYTGDTNALGVFHSGCSNLSLDSGLVLSTGWATLASGPNNSSSAGYNLNLVGNVLLDGLIGGTTFDAATIEFDMVPQFDSIAFRYIFGSEEYPEFVNQYNDVFAFFVSGPNPNGGNYVNQNIAIIPGTTGIAVTIDNINNGPSNSGPCVNCQYYVDNTENSLQLDAFTTPLKAAFVAVPGANYHLVITIADALDHSYDSDVFLEAASFSSPAGDVMLSGTIEYDNIQKTPIVNAVVKLKQAGVTIAQTNSNAYGNYQFSNVPGGTYDLEVSHNAPWGGVNSADALLIQNHFVGYSQLNGLRLKAANLNGIGGVNSADALLAGKRFVGFISSFPNTPDWIFETDSVTLTPGSAVIKDVEGLCAGDVNGSFVP